MNHALKDRQSMSVAERAIDLEQTLRERFGREQFRPGQREVIENVVQGRDVLCVMPTGGGKSLCYQLPALMLPGLTLVVSPLIALMKDQIDQLHARGIAASRLDSSLTADEARDVYAAIEAVRTRAERDFSGVWGKAPAEIEGRDLR